MWLNLVLYIVCVSSVYFYLRSCGEEACIEHDLITTTAMMKMKNKKVVWPDSAPVSAIPERRQVIIMMIIIVVIAVN